MREHWKWIGATGVVALGVGCGDATIDRVAELGCIAPEGVDVRLGDDLACLPDRTAQVPESPMLYVVWGENAEQPEVSLTWQGEEVTITWEVDTATVDGCAFSLATARFERSLAAGQIYDVTSDGAPSGLCDRNVGRLEVSGKEHSFCGSDRPACTSDDDCPAPWTCDAGECHALDTSGNRSCAVGSDPDAACLAQTGDPATQCILPFESPPSCLVYDETEFGELNLAEPNSCDHGPTAFGS